MYHLIAKDKVAEQHILGKYSNCNSFGVTMALLYSQYFKVAITQLSKVQTMYHLIAKDKVAEQHVSKKNCNCNTF